MASEVWQHDAAQSISFCVILSEAKDLKTPLGVDSHAEEILRFTQDDKMCVVSMIQHYL